MQKPGIQPHWSLRDSIYRIVDLVGILVGMWLATNWTDRSAGESYMLVAVAAVVLFQVVSEFSGLYRSWRGVSLEQEASCLLLTWATTVPCLLGFSVLTHYAHWVDAPTLLRWSGATLMVTLVSRALIRGVARYLRARGYNLRGYAVVGMNELGFELVRRIDASPELGLQFLGYYDDRDEQRLPDAPEASPARRGAIENLIADANAGRVSMVYITFPMRAEDRIRDVLDQLSDTTASVYVVPDFFVFQLLHSRWTHIHGLPAVSIFENPLYGVDGLLKRSVDVVVASLLLLAAAVPMLLIALMVKCTSPGPVFYRQKRYGLDGREILVWKFRSMRVCETPEQFRQAKPNDPRVTPFGAFLRKTSLDELPQLFHVLQGTMSLVGPRPHATMQNEQYRKLIQGYMLRHKIKPGLTGLAQVNGWRGETDTLEKMERRVECDHRYIREWSPLMDLKILLRTILVVLSRKNAH